MSIIEAFWTLVHLLVAVWVVWDALKRGQGPSRYLWSIGTAVLGPAGLALYFGFRPRLPEELDDANPDDGRVWKALVIFLVGWLAEASTMIAYYVLSRN